MNNMVLIFSCQCCQVGLPGLDSMNSALNMLRSMKELPTVIVIGKTNLKRLASAYGGFLMFLFSEHEET